MPVLIIPTTEDGDVRFEYAVDDEAAVKTAMEKFNDLVKNQKRVAYALGENGGDSRILKEFDPTADKIAFMPQRQGG